MRFARISHPTSLGSCSIQGAEKDPNDRFPSMLEFKETLEHVERTMGGEPAGQRSEGRLPRTTRQNLSTSRAPQQMPKPILDMPDTQSISSRFD